MMKLIRLTFITFLFLTSICSNAQFNKTYFNWTSHPNLIIELDSLLLNSSKYGLKIADYNRNYLIQFIGKKEEIRAKNVNTDSLIHSVALHFFLDLAYGNSPPSFAYPGLSYKFDYDVVNALLQASANKNSLKRLVTQFNNESSEIIALLKELNNKAVTLTSKRIKIISKAINDYRWLNSVRKNSKLILVNIPSTNLQYYDKGIAQLNMKVIVGKYITPTVTLSSKLNQIIINPYWNVPRSIMVREMLPYLKNDPGYIDRNHLELRGLNYKTVNPYNVDWRNVDTVNFPYYIRQSTGCDNSLGVIKLDFDNPFGIYIHDTPEKSLFSLKNRFFSHGCIRMEKPIELAKFLLNNNKLALDTINLDNCYKNPTPINIQIQEKINVVVWYHLIEVDQQGNIRYYNDIYNKFK